MSYEPLHHKYRPQTFAQLVGQEAIATTLSNALQQRRIAPAYLFTGPRGTGKTSSARILAKSLNCINSEVPTPAPCGVCEVCRAIARGSALDIIEIDAASNTGVDNIRELIERAQFAPVQCRYKVYVIDECHMLSIAAFNALLKTLEEPPDRVVFVLATTDPQRVLPTIISRCQRFDFRRIPLEAMVEHLKLIASKEQINIASDAVQLVAQISQGGLRDAESLLDQLSLLDGEITVERVWELVGAVPERDLLELVRAIATNNPAATLDQARHLMDRGREPLIVLQNLASFYRDLLIAKTAPHRGDLVAITPPTWVELQEFVQDLSLAAILAGQQHLRAAEVQVKSTTQPRLWLEVILMGLLPSAIASPTQSIEQGEQRGARTQPAQGRSPAAAPHVAGRPHEAAAPPSATPNPASQHANLQESPSPLTQPLEETHQPLEASAPPEDAEPAAKTAEESADAVPPQANAGAAEPTNLDLLWHEVLGYLLPPSTQMLLRQQGRLMSFDSHTAQIGVSAGWHKTVKERASRIEAAFEKACNHPVVVRIDVAAPPPQSSPSPASPPVDPMPTAESPGSSANSGSSPPPSAFPPKPISAQDASMNGQSLSPNGQSLSPNGQNLSSNGHPRPSQPTPPLESPPADDPNAMISPPAWKAEDKVTEAAKSLANFFNGQVVDLDGEIELPSGFDSFVADSSGADLGDVDAGADLEEDELPF
jgi:DNA polymerase-3 subunit gamma/tau